MTRLVCSYEVLMYIFLLCSDPPVNPMLCTPSMKGQAPGSVVPNTPLVSRGLGKVSHLLCVVPIAQQFFHSLNRSKISFFFKDSPYKYG